MKKHVLNLGLCLLAATFGFAQNKSSNLATSGAPSQLSFPKSYGNSADLSRGSGPLPAPTTTVTGTCMSVNLPAPAGWTLSNYNVGPGNGFLAGTNIYGDLEKASFFNLSSTTLTQINQVYVGFAEAYSANPNAQDYRIRYAFEGTEYYGSYMTDIIKDFPMLSSKDVMIYLKAHPEVISLQLDNFRKEMKFIRSDRPMILAFGKQVYKILKKGLNEKEYSALIQLTHYSHQISKENYRADTHKRLGIKVG